MKHQICRTVLAVAAVTVGVCLSACGLFRTPADDVFDNAEDAIATDGAASKIKPRKSSTNSATEKHPRFVSMRRKASALMCWTAKIPQCSA